MKYITIKDIAKELNVAVSTVSRAFNDKYDIRPETRDRILKKASEMGYRPNPIARKLVQQRSFNIGIIIPEFENSFFPQVIIGAQEILYQHNYQVLIMQSNESVDLEIMNAKTLVDNMVDGLIISLSGVGDNLSYYKELAEKKMPLVFFNRVPENIEASKVVFDDYKWAFFATEHLIHQGFKDILFISGTDNLMLSKNRQKGYNDAHKKHRIPTGEKITCGFSMKDGDQIAKKLISENNIPRAILAANDACAIGMIRVFKDSGFRIPEDIAIVGFSETKMAAHISPTLTSVEQPTYEIGKAAAQLLLEQVQNKGIHIPQTIVLNGRLNVRESSVVLS